MPEKTKPNKEFQIPAEKEIVAPSEDRRDDNWSRDQQEKSYYYDDSYGYEIYDPEADEDEEDD